MKRARLAFWIRTHKKQTIAIIILVLALIGVGVFFILRSRDSVARVETSTGTKPTKPLTVASPLTGRQVSPGKAKRPVTAVVIENSPEARPQSGLHKAGLVFEAIAEGGITRFVTFFQEDRPAPLGPVRSLRPYFNDWVMAFDAPVAHVGGSAVAIREAREFNVRDLDQFTNPQAYWRSTDRYAPHNVYTNFSLLDKLNKSKGFKKSNFEPWPRKDADPPVKTTARVIDMPISSYTYDVQYRYNRKDNNYKRFMAGEPHKDRESKKQIAPDVIIAIKVENWIKTNGRYAYDLIGNGKAVIFQDGRVIKGKWYKSDRDQMIEFKLKNGNYIKLNPGRTWITAVSPGDNVKYKP